MIDGVLHLVQHRFEFGKIDLRRGLLEVGLHGVLKRGPVGAEAVVEAFELASALDRRRVADRGSVGLLGGNHLLNLRGGSG